MSGYSSSINAEAFPVTVALVDLRQAELGHRPDCEAIILQDFAIEEDTDRSALVQAL